MTDSYKIQDILEAVDSILENKNEEKPLKLVNEIENSNQSLDKIPKDTELIIKQAEKYIKNN
tara:strand:+ start:58 stop:243 length:186 start_codon:yes stop_codon:yes gene_type:complete